MFFNRRQFLAAGAAIGAAADAGRRATTSRKRRPTRKPAPRRRRPTRPPSLYPFKRNETYKLDRDVTDEQWATTYNNYYEFSSGKNLAEEAQALPIRPWVLTIDGMVEKPMQIGIDDLMKKMPLEERLYRHRCVETWSMAVPWSGFALKELVKLAQPKAEAKYLRFETFMKPEVAPEQKTPFYPWPYVEGLTIEEANNDLAFMVTGMYGKPAPKQNGAPLRIALPWKYGFKSGKGAGEDHLHRPAAGEFLAGAAGLGIRLLGQRQSGGPASALEPGQRARARQRRAAADADLQRLWRVRGAALCQPAGREALHVTVEWYDALAPANSGVN